MGRTFFVDTWAYRALADKRDPAHKLAQERMRAELARGAIPVTSNYILDEAYTGIRMKAGARAVLAFGEDIQSLVSRSALRVEWIDEARERAAWALFARFTNLRDLSFTDCTSFALMHELRIERVLSGDSHFEKVNLGFLLV